MPRSDRRCRVKQDRGVEPTYEGKGTMAESTSACQTEGMTAHYLGPAEVAARLGLSPHTIRQYATRGIMPVPDVRIGPNAGWSTETIDQWWANRPGRGARTDLRK